MQFEFRRHAGTRSPVTDAATFRVDRVIETAAHAPSDLSHLIDSSYEYHSPRELRWHLAERLGLSPRAVRLHEAA